MQGVSVVRKLEIARSPRVMQLEGIFDLPESNKVEHVWNVALPEVKDDWQIGLIVGPSGCGKSSIIDDLFPESVFKKFHCRHTDSACI